MVDQPALVEIGDKLLHRKILAYRVDAFDAVVRVAKNPKVAINPFKRCLLHPFLKLPIGFEGFDRSIGQRLDQLSRHTEEMHQALFALAARLLTTFRDVDGKGQRNVLLLILEAFTMYTEVLAQLVRWID